MADAIRTSPTVGRVEVIGFDLARSLINVLGEEHYPHAEYLYHELAANSYDEDASEVHIEEKVIEPGTRGRVALMDIRVWDDGNGMAREHLRHYFRVGDSEKVQRQFS